MWLSEMSLAVRDSQPVRGGHRGGGGGGDDMEKGSGAMLGPRPGPGIT